MKELDLKSIKKCNHKIVEENYYYYKPYIEKAEILLETGEYDSLRSIATTLFPKISYTLFYKAFKKYSSVELSIKSNGKQHNTRKMLSNRRKISEDDKDKIIDMYLTQNHTLEYIGKYYKTTATTIMSFLQRHGVSRRTKSQIMQNRLDNDIFREQLRQNGINSYLNRRYSSTQPELHFEGWLKKNDIRYETQYREIGNKHPYDFFLCDYNLLVEIDGHYWHSKPKQAIKDQKHVDDAIRRGYNIVRICTKELKESNWDYTKWICLD
jgi:very-short-patch-repair endonuclease